MTGSNSGQVIFKHMIVSFITSVGPNKMEMVAISAGSLRGLNVIALSRRQYNICHTVIVIIMCVVYVFACTHVCALYECSTNRYHKRAPHTPGIEVNR